MRQVYVQQAPDERDFDLPGIHSTAIWPEAHQLEPDESGREWLRVRRKARLRLVARYAFLGIATVLFLAFIGLRLWLRG